MKRPGRILQNRSSMATAEADIPCLMPAKMIPDNLVEGFAVVMPTADFKQVEGGTILRRFLIDPDDEDGLWFQVSDRDLESSREFYWPSLHAATPPQRRPDRRSPGGDIVQIGLRY